MKKIFAIILMALCTNQAIFAGWQDYFSYFKGAVSAYGHSGTQFFSPKQWGLGVLTIGTAALLAYIAKKKIAQKADLAIGLEKLRKNLQDIEPEKEFLEALQNNDINKVRSLLSKHLDLIAQYCEKHNINPLINAARNGTIAMAELLIKNGFQINKPEAQSITALWIAVRNNNIEMVQYLLTQGADITMVYRIPKGPRPARMDAAMQAGGNILQFPKNPTITKLLIRAGADVNKRDDPERTPLHVVAENLRDDSGHKVIKILCDAGANLLAQDWDGSTPLHSFMKNASPSLSNEFITASIKLFLYYAWQKNELKALLDAKDRHSNTIADYVELESSQFGNFLSNLKKGDPKSLKELIDFGSSFDYQNRDTQTNIASLLKSREITGRKLF